MTDAEFLDALETRLRLPFYEPVTLEEVRRLESIALINPVNQWPLPRSYALEFIEMARHRLLRRAKERLMS